MKCKVEIAKQKVIVIQDGQQKEHIIEKGDIEKLNDEFGEDNVDIPHEEFIEEEEAEFVEYKHMVVMSTITRGDMVYTEPMSLLEIIIIRNGHYEVRAPETVKIIK